MTNENLLKDDLLINKIQKYIIKPIPKFINHLLLQKLFKKHFNLEKSDYKLKFRLKSNKAIIESNKDIKTTSFEYRNQKITIYKQTEDNNINESLIIKKKNKIEIKDIRDIVTPLWKLTYNETIEKKTKELKNAFKNKDINISFIPTNNFLRNKFEFTFGFLIENNIEIPSLGFRGTSFLNGKNLIFCPLKVIFIPENIKNNLKLINKELKESIYSNLIFNRETKTGILKIMITKYFENEIINLITLHESTKNNLENFYNLILNKNINEKDIIYQNLEKNINEIDKKNIKEFKLIIKFLIKLSENIKNIYFSFDSSTHEGVFSSKIYKISGNSFLKQKVFNFEFKISFFSFFQTNIECFEKIIKDIKNKINSLNNKEILLDLCCGSAVIGILFSEMFKKVIGLEINPNCLIDAKINMLENKINNYEYHLLDIKYLKQLDFSNNLNLNYFAILDPPRAGVPKSVIKNIRDNNNIKQLIFICCDYKKSKINLDDLCRPSSNEYKNSPFFIEKIIGYDMFPFTEKMEVVFYLFRN